MSELTRISISLETALLDAFGEVLSGDPRNVMAHHNRAMTLTKLGRREEALAAHGQALTMAPDQAFFHTQKGIALAAAGEIDSALIQFDAQLVELSALHPHRSGAGRGICPVRRRAGGPVPGNRCAEPRLRGDRRKRKSPLRFSRRGFIILAMMSICP